MKFCRLAVALIAVVMSGCGSESETTRASDAEAESRKPSESVPAAIEACIDDFNDEVVPPDALDSQSAVLWAGLAGKAQESTVGSRFPTMVLANDGNCLFYVKILTDAGAATDWWLARQRSGTWAGPDLLQSSSLDGPVALPIDPSEVEHAMYAQIVEGERLEALTKDEFEDEFDVEMANLPGEVADEDEVGEPASSGEPNSSSTTYLVNGDGEFYTEPEMIVPGNHPFAMDIKWDTWESDEARGIGTVCTSEHCATTVSAKLILRGPRECDGRMVFTVLEIASPSPSTEDVTPGYGRCG